MNSQLSTTYCIVTEVAQWAAPIVAVDHCQLRSMTSEIEDPIDWPFFLFVFLLASAFSMQ